jgi:hypothetical protein
MHKQGLYSLHFWREAPGGGVKVRLFGAVFLVMLAALAANAQEFRGKIQGFITDSSKAYVAGARVTLHNNATGVETSTTSDPSGHYLFDLVDVGTYTVTAQMQGFEKFVQENVTVPVRGDVTVNIMLTIGAVTAEVTVTSAPPPVEFNTAKVEDVITRQMVQSIPQTDRDPFDLALLDPTVTFNADAGPDTPFAVWGASSIKVAGTGGRQGEVSADGVTVKAGDMTGYVPNPDAVEEFVVSSNSADAELGFSSGGVISLVTKSGTNALHGSLLFQGRNPSLEAYTFIADTPNLNRRNIENVSVGNPIKRNKLFTFNSFEKWGYTSPILVEGKEPTDAQRQGDFSQTLTASGVLNVIYDPTTTVINTATNTETRTAFQGNIIPPSQIDPTAARMMQYMWAPNHAPSDPSGTNNFILNTPDNNSYWNYLDRTDWNASEKFKIFGRFGKSATNQTAPMVHSIAESNYWDGSDMHSNNFVADGAYTLNQSTVLDVKFGYSYVDQTFKSPSINLTYQQFAALWGGNNWGQSYYGNASWLRFPALNIDGTSGFGNSFGWMQYGHTYTLEPKVMLTKGRHSMKMGFEWRHEPFTDGWPVAPSFNFYASGTANTGINPNTALYGNGYATFLLGAMGSGSEASYEATIRPIETIYGTFFQDDFRLSPRVTLQLGLRVDKDTGPYEANNQIMQYINLNETLPALAAANPQLPAQAQQIRAQYGIPAPNWKGAAVYATPSNRRMFHTPVAIQPRLGAAIRLNDKTALRLSYSRFTSPAINVVGALQLPVGEGGSYGYTAYGYAVNTPAPGFVGDKPTTYLNNPFPSGVIPAAGNSLGGYSVLGESVLWNKQNWRSPFNDRFSVSLQRDLPLRVVADFTYLFSYGSDQAPQTCPYTTVGTGCTGEGGTAAADDGQTFWTDYNIFNPMIGASLGSLLNTSVANPFYNLLPANQMPGVLGTMQYVPLSQLLAPYPYYAEGQGGLAEMGRTGLHSKLHMPTIKLTRPIASGLLAQFQYAYLHNSYQDFLGNTMDEFLGTPEWLTDLQPRHRAAMIVVWQLPFGHGRHFLGSANRALDAAIGGWDFSANYQWRSGAYITFGDVVVVGNPVISNPTSSDWFNTNVIYPKREPYVDPYSLRTAPFFYPGLTGPGFWNLDASVAKEFRLTERLGLQFRMEMYNATNTWLQAGPSNSVDSPFFGQVPPGTPPQTVARTTQYQARLTF